MCACVEKDKPTNQTGKPKSIFSLLCHPRWSFFLKDRLHQKSKAIENNVLAVREELVF